MRIEATIEQWKDLYEVTTRILMLTMQQSMNLSTEYAMFNQKNLTCYWGKRDELSDKQ